MDCNYVTVFQVKAFFTISMPTFECLHGNRQSQWQIEEWFQISLGRFEHLGWERGMEMDSPSFREADTIAFPVFSRVFCGLLCNYFILKGQLFYMFHCRSPTSSHPLPLGAGALGRPRGMVWGERREEGSGWGTHVYLWRIHFDIWQN